MKAKIEAGAEIEFLTPAEAKQAFTDALVELYRGVKWVDRAALGTVTGTGALSITAEDFGPEGGFVWGVQRLSVYGLANNESVNVYKNEVAPSRFICSIGVTEPMQRFSRQALVLNPNERLVIAGTSLTASASIAVSVGAAELPERMGWQLL